MRVGFDIGSKAPRGVRGASERLVHGSEIVVVTAAQLLLVVCILLATFILYAIFVSRIPTSIHALSSIDDLQNGVERVFAGVMLLLLGLELLKILSTFFVGFRFQVEIIMVVAIIAVTRHIMLIDLEHTQAETIFAAAALVLALAISYALVRQRGEPEPDGDQEPS
jgi:uncharacterized membrane protein (DUF373 family)